MPRKEAEVKLLAQPHDGAFLIRDSESTPGLFPLHPACSFILLVSWSSSSYV